MSVFYNQSHVIQWLGRHTVQKARGYRATSLRWEGHTLRGRVQGSEPRPYEVRALFNPSAGRLLKDGRCSCPMSYNCKHVAALLLTNLEQPAAPDSGIRSELMEWLDEFRLMGNSTSSAKAKPASKATHALLYMLTKSPDGQASVRIFKSRLNSDGVMHAIESPWSNIDTALTKPVKFIAEADLPILRELRKCAMPLYSYDSYYSPRGESGAALFEQLLATQRLVVAIGKSSSLISTLTQARKGAQRGGHVAWTSTPDSRLQPELRTDPPSSFVFATQPPWYVDARSGETGPVDTPLQGKRLERFLEMPAVTLQEAPLVGAILGEIAPDLPPPPAGESSAMRRIDTPPTPVLMLDSLPLVDYGWSTEDGTHVDLATAHFDYEDVRIEAINPVALTHDEQGRVLHIKRDAAAEKQYLSDLQKLGLRKKSTNHLYIAESAPKGALGPKDVDEWPHVMQEVIPRLRQQGWRVVVSERFSFNVIVIDNIEGHLQPAAEGWFDLDMGISVNDRTVSLVPLLAALFQRDKRWLSGALDSIDDGEMIELRTDLGERLHIRALRLKPIVRTLIDLFDRLEGDTPLRVSVWDAGRLQALHDTARWQFHGGDAIRALANRLLAGPGMDNTPPPRELAATLRPYQLQGLGWMQFLRANELSGVLADDMGLGKTIQTLAHILAEKEAGRLDRPALVVMPTTLMHNWRDEAERFAPTLRVLDLHGAQRREHFERIGEHDLILTTYALIWRDEDALAAHDYHLLILDEAQYVKNADTKAGATIRKLKARHRLCLTGTPLENHLGELWSQFDFLLPGFLGSQKDFTKRWRTPIEKNGDAIRRQLLAKRIRPFMLRRRKDEVAKELPPKTTIAISVELEGAQRDLYESVRSAMQKKVRDAIAGQGFARSHIIVLEALLKLRQVCCDPRLVKTGQAAKVKQSAKLETLLDMLPPMIEEGRRILLFSQFTSMLQLIATALDAREIPFVTLTGETTNRAAPVKQFNQGKVPVFLISLKAGGVGLNLTAADTVIHYDPWWNPAVENQATDRAHRIGQDKPVFVYKLVTVGSIEEKIVALQERKAQLANAILSDDGANVAKFSAEEIESLFEPLPPA
jgi:superfamily II DNA or RNA helicase